MSPKAMPKWERSFEVRPSHNIISSDFPKYYPQPSYFASLLGKPCIGMLLSYEYHRMWLKEREAWQKRMYPDNVENVDVIKAYATSFKNKPQPPKIKKKEPFKIEKFKNVPSKTDHRRPPGDMAMCFNKIKTPGDVYQGIGSKISTKRSSDDNAMTFYKILRHMQLKMSCRPCDNHQYSY